jgi:hypothetical protein
MKILTQNDIPELPTISQQRYENIFHVFETDKQSTDKKYNNKYYFYNILNKVSIPADVDPNIFEYYKIDKPYPWTTISYRIYTTQFLWWLIAICNNIRNPVIIPKTGDVIRVIKPDFVSNVLNSIKEQI